MKDEIDDDNMPELKLTGKSAILCTSAYLKKKKELSRILGITFAEADKLLQDKGIDRLTDVVDF